MYIPKSVAGIVWYSLVVAAIIFIANLWLSPDAEAGDNYGATHGLIAAGVVGGASLVTTEPVPLGIVATGACAWFVGREMRGDGDLLANADRIADWAVPCAVSAGVWVWRKDQAVLPWFKGDVVGVQYRMEIK